MNRWKMNTIFKENSRKPTRVKHTLRMLRRIGYHDHKESVAGWVPRNAFMILKSKEHSQLGRFFIKVLNYY